MPAPGPTQPVKDPDRPPESQSTERPAVPAKRKDVERKPPIARRPTQKETKPGQKDKPTDKPTPVVPGSTTTGPITVQPGGVVSVGQQGGVTAGTYISQALAEISAEWIVKNEVHPQNGRSNIYQTRYCFTISGATIPVLSVRSGSRYMLSMDLGHEGMRSQREGPLINGAKEISVEQAYGLYCVYVNAKNPSEIDRLLICGGVQCECSGIECK